jgi:branched-subunit amino acid aminotransferase/4-amino-4-deoxychorismate lyase
VRNLELNGRHPDRDETLRLATRNYGHFTSMQVRDRAVRGLALHVARLADGNDEFFGWSMGVDEEARLLGLIRHALGDATDASVRVAYVPGADENAPPEVLIAVDEPRPDTAGPPPRVMLDGYRRDWPEHKHAATMGLRHAVRRARLSGYDDALFAGADGLVSEGTTWNVAFLDGDEIVWPQAPMLRGITMVLLQLALSMHGTPWSLRPVQAAELAGLDGAVAVNSTCPAQPIASIGDVSLPAGDKLAGLLRDAWQTVPYDAL